MLDVAPRVGAQRQAQFGGKLDERFHSVGAVELERAVEVKENCADHADGASTVMASPTCNVPLCATRASIPR